MSQVVVGLIVRKGHSGEDEYLLVSSKQDFGEFTGYYYPPGGHMNEGESEPEALAREIKEELGVEVVPVRKMATTPSDVANQVTHWWLCRALSDELKINSNEVTDAGYFSQSMMKTMKVWPATRDFFEKYIFSN